MILVAAFLVADFCRDGAAALERRDLQSAEALLKQCQTLQGYVMLAGIYQLQQNSDALYHTALEGLKRFPSEKRFYLTVGTHEARHNRYEGATKVLEEAFRRWPDDPKIRALLASSHFALGTELLDSAKHEAAVRSLNRAIELAPDDIEALVNLGRALHNLLRHVEARKVFDRVIEMKSSYPLARFHRGMALYALGEFDSAIADLTKELESNPNYPPARLIRGLALIANAEWERALSDLDVAAASMPGNARAHHGRARALIQAGKLAEAEIALRRAMELDPTDPAPVNTLVSVLMRLDRQDEGRTLAKRAAELARDRRK
jgi:Flp pilus assembly protein TadD